MSEATAWAVEVRPRDEGLDPKRNDLIRLLAAREYPADGASHRRLYLISAPRTPALVASVGRLAADPLLAAVVDDDGIDGWVVDVSFHPGVTDSEGDSFAEAIARDGFAGVRVRTGHRYRLPAAVPESDARAIAAALAHPVVERSAWRAVGDDAFAEWAGAAFMPAAAATAQAAVVPIRGLDAADLVRLSSERLLALPAEDMLAVQAHFVGLDRDPTDVELETVAQTWSEHCAHRTFKATIVHREPGVPDREIEGLLRTFIASATDEVRRPWVLSAFEDNAGVIALDAKREISFKVETHNHPSAIEPFGGANTGVGGVVRDVMGVSAQPIANTDVLCFGPLDLPASDLPAGSLPPAEIFDGVVAGVADYGNKMGIPTVNGATLFDPGFAANPLVFCGTVGLAPRGARPRRVGVGDFVVVVGGRAGRDGIHGATFSSEVLDAGQAATLGSVVQIGDPIVEKRIADVLPLARDRGLYTAITDCGAGGLSSAIGEMASDLGAEVDLALVPLKYPGLEPWEIWLSEAQERMVLSVPPDRWPELRKLVAAEGVEGTALGRFTGAGRLVVRHGETVVADLDCGFLHRGAPVRRLESRWSGPPPGDRPEPLGGDLTPWLERLLAEPNVASKEEIVRRYDHEVQGRTVGKPFVGPDDIGPADAAVVWPAPDSPRAVAVGCGINPRYGRIDPYAMALLVADEALRNIVAVGADPNRTAILDNFCWGNPTLPDRLGGLVRACMGCHDAAVGLRLPFISGKDSLFNEYRTPNGEVVPIPGTLLISAIGIVPDVGRTCSSHLKADGNVLYLVGATGDDLGGSLLWSLRGVLGNRAPVADPKRARGLFGAVHRAIKAGLVRACHDPSEGGLAVAAAEMVIGAGGLGLEIDLAGMPVRGERPDAEALLFGESPTRFLLEVEPEDAPEFERVIGGRPWARVGRVLGEPVLRIAGAGATIDADAARLRRAWRTPLWQEVLA